MDMRISGRGSIPAGEYEKISVHGRGRLFGMIKCKSFSSSGKSTGDSIECAEKMKSSGTAHFSGSVDATRVTSSGRFFCDGDLTASAEINCSGTLTCHKTVRCNRLFVAGTARMDKGVEAEQIELRGSVRCQGLINAEEVTVKMEGNVDIGCIGGSRITVCAKATRRWLKRIPLLSRVIKNARIQTSIEGDEIRVEQVSCPRITGRAVTVGRGCRIDLVQYSEHIEIAKTARVGRTEQL